MTWLATVLGWAFSICLFLCIFIGLFLWAGRWGGAEKGVRSSDYGGPQRY